MQLKMIITAAAGLIGGLGSVGRSYIRPKRADRETSLKGSVMQDLLGLFVLIALGFAIAAANVWFAMLLRDFWAKEQAPTLGPIKLVGDDARSATAANALPGLVVNHLNYERNQINNALGILTSLQDEEKHSLQPQGEYLPPSVFPLLSKSLDIELKIGAVDYGAILKAVSTWLTPSRTLDLTVAVTSAGNVVTTGTSAPKSGGLYPENENGLRVAASDLKGLPTSFSPLGPDLIWAPGTNVLVTEDGHSFAMRSGTSYSASIAAAATAILLSANPEATPSEIRRAFSATARQVEPNGASIINVDAASQQLSKAPPAPK